MWFVVGMQCLNIALFFGGQLVLNLINETNSPLEIFSLGMVCSAMMLQVFTAIFGLCVAMFQFDSVIGVKRFWLIFCMHVPSLVIVGVLVYVQT